MKKLLVLMMALALTLSLAACGGDNTTPASTSDITLVNKVANYTALLVPGDFDEFSDKDGNAVAKGPNASIVVTPTFPTDTWIEDVTEDYMLKLLVDTYSNIEVLAFDNPANIAGVDSVSFLSTGDSNTGGKNMTVCQIILYFSIDGQNCEQHLVFTYATGANSSLEANLADILPSIKLE
ncbi:MAG TPA: hypothetical protein DDZ65_08005 [Firmicutes bacterium]|nr:hypothetical protein [Bacillota bacterium]